MRITFDPAARADLDDIFEWIFKDNEAAAHEMIASVRAEQGNSGRNSACPANREQLSAAWNDYFGN